MNYKILYSNIMYELVSDYDNKQYNVNIITDSTSEKIISVYNNDIELSKESKEYQEVINYFK